MGAAFLQVTSEIVAPEDSLLPDRFPFNAVTLPIITPIVGWALMHKPRALHYCQSE